MSTFANPLNAAMQTIFPTIEISSGEIIDVMKSRAVPTMFRIVTADPDVVTDLPQNINRGFGAQGVFFPTYGELGNGALFLWQARDNVQSTRARLWFNTFRGGVWNNVWKLVTMTDTPSA